MLTPSHDETGRPTSKTRCWNTEYVRHVFGEAVCATDGVHSALTVSRAISFSEDELALHHYKLEIALSCAEFRGIAIAYVAENGPSPPNGLHPLIHIETLSFPN